MLEFEVLWFNSDLPDQKDQRDQDSYERLLNSISINININKNNRFHNIQQTIKFLTESTNKWIVISSGGNRKELAENLKDLKSVLGVFILCSINALKEHSNLARNYKFIRGVYNNFDEILEELKKIRINDNTMQEDVSYSKANNNLELFEETLTFPSQNIQETKMITTIQKDELHLPFNNNYFESFEESIEIQSQNSQETNKIMNKQECVQNQNEKASVPIALPFSGADISEKIRFSLRIAILVCTLN